MIRKNNRRVSKLPPDAQVVLARQRRFYSKLIYRAICDIVNYRDAMKPQDREIHESAMVWMYNGVETSKCEDEETWRRMKEFDDVMSFETACSALDWDPSWVREKVKGLTKKDLAHIGRNGLI